MHRPLRLVIGLGLLPIAVGAMWLSLGFDWGVAVTTFLPGLVLLVPAVALLHRSELRLLDQEGERPVLERVAGWWRLRPAGRVGLERIVIEIVPTAGFRTVVAHVDEREWVLAGWLGRNRAEELVAWLERAHGTALPRRQRAAAYWDV